jgi:hypothetical protein
MRKIQIPKKSFLNIFKLSLDLFQCNLLYKPQKRTHGILVHPSQSPKISMISIQTLSLKFLRIKL